MGYIGRTPTGSILTGADIADGSISTAKLADTAVSTAKIADTAISTAKIADDAVGNTKLDLTANYAFTGTITGAGAYNLLQTQTASSSSTISFTSTYLNSTYNHYYVVIENATFSTDGADGTFEFSTDNGSSYSSTGSFFNQIAYDSTFRVNGPTVSQSSMRTFSSVDGDNANNNGIGTLEMHMFNLSSTTDKKLVWFVASNHTQGGDAGKYLIGQFGLDTTSAVNNIRLGLNSSATYVTGKFKLYGVS